MNETLHRPSAIEVLARKIVDLEHLTPRVRDREKPALRAEIRRLHRRIGWLRYLEAKGKSL